MSLYWHRAFGKKSRLLDIDFESGQCSDLREISAMVGYRHENKEIRRERLSGPTVVKTQMAPLSPHYGCPSAYRDKVFELLPSRRHICSFDFSYNWPATKMFIGLDHRGELAQQRRRPWRCIAVALRSPFSLQIPTTFRPTLPLVWTTTSIYHRMLSL